MKISSLFPYCLFLPLPSTSSWTAEMWKGERNVGWGRSSQLHIWRDNAESGKPQRWMLKFVSVAETKERRYMQRCCTNKHRRFTKPQRGRRVRSATTAASLWDTAWCWSCQHQREKEAAGRVLKDR